MSETTYTFEQFKRMGKELIDAAPTLDVAGLENGLKMFGIAYLSIEDSPLNLHQAAILLRLTHQQVEKVAQDVYYQTSHGAPLRPRPSSSLTR